MNFFVEAIAWILDPRHYGGENGIDTRIVEHLVISFGVVLVAALIAVPLGYAIGHTGRGRAAAIALSGGIRALPTLGLLILIALGVGIGLTAPFIALVVLAIPSILAGAYSGFEAVDRRTIDAARSVGMTEWQVVGRVEVPLGLPLLIGGLRAASLQVIATATLADYVGGGGLGHFLFLGLKTNDYPQVLAGSFVVILLAIVSEILFGVIQRLVIPAGVSAGMSTNVRVRSPRSQAATG
ncbi:ABC transporter permease [Lacisediminihabitans profunda]|uniref:ABC transporter permease subunit n=1 Tax=Lacisediminihabitans profunda TaxID=2594790 RepID=A0A5C8UVV8_9MICO|nr:ABC transporter permease subunit [Lacisediminihabitans profunda]TXN32834.1 ABC transporter permease subunit [Lacisediminihabitans profunda]